MTISVFGFEPKMRGSVIGAAIVCAIGIVAWGIGTSSKPPLPPLIVDYASNTFHVRNAGERELTILRYKVECRSGCAPLNPAPNYRLGAGERLDIETPCPIKSLRIYTDRGGIFFTNDRVYARNSC